jgi:TM2 domain-containing membrane protein YozV
MAEEKKAQSKIVMAVICWLVGMLGIHRFMLGHTGIGVLMLLTGGVCGILVIVDLIRILTGSLKYADGRELT